MNEKPNEKRRKKNIKFDDIITWFGFYDADIIRQHRQP